jgi:RND family efflux transporter MFP subunit
MKRKSVSVWALCTALSFAIGCNEKHPQAIEPPPPVVLVATPIEREVKEHQVFTARTQAVQSVEVKARVTGYLTKINFVDGADVKAGDVLFEIDDRPYKAALDKALAAVETAKAAVVKTTADFQIADKIRKDDPNALSLQDYTKTIGARDEAKGNLDQAKSNLESAQLNYNWCKVVAPISGRANTHFVDVGNLVTADMTTLTNLVSLQPMWAYFYVDQNTAQLFEKQVLEGKVKSARESKPPVEMSTKGSKEYPYKGFVDFVSNQFDPATGSIRVRAEFPNDDKDQVPLLAGLFGRIRVPIGGLHKALLVNDRAIGVNQGQKLLYVVGADNKVEMRLIETSQLHDGLREVIATRTDKESDSGGKSVTKTVVVLKPDDRVIVDGLQRVRPGTVVSPTLVDMATLLPAAKSK